ncbi:MAG: hypothetical protein AAF657_33725 [Acidobacteriota bacterium]
MRDLAKSMLRFSWATGLLGASQLSSLLTGGRGPSSAGGRRAPGLGGLDAVTWTTQGQLGEMLQAAFQAGDDLQDDWADLLGDAMQPWRWRRAAQQLAERSTFALGFANPGTGGALCRQELKNKFEVYWLVKGVRKMLDLPPAGQPFALRPYVERAYGLEAYSALWVIEGLGHDYAELALERHAPPHGLLAEDVVAGLPESCLPMLHGGLGLACAEHTLRQLTPESSVRTTREALESFVALCRDNALERYADSAIEALGLDARCFFPDLVPVLTRGLEALGDRQLARFFWHGLGRAIYFLPVNFIPGYGSLWQAVRMAERESPHAAAYDDALAGVAYAFAMVNMSHPGILERVLHAHGETLRGTPFAEGIVASVVMRHEITPGAPVLDRFIGHQPMNGTGKLWDDVVRRPCREALGLDGGEPMRLADLYRAMADSEAGE